MAFIVGQDVSNFQGQIDFPTYSQNSNFLIAKATEGTGFIDTWYGNNRQQARQNNLPFGSYHFARPDLGNDAIAEAKFFCAVIDGDPIKQGEVLALDFEVQYNDPVNWCKQWLDYVSEHYNGLKPLFYTYQDMLTKYDWQPLVDAGYGLWVAGYTYDPTNNNVQTGAWQFAAMQQWTDKQTVPGISGNVDGDVFFGDQLAFGKYGYQVPQPQIQQTSTPPEIVLESTTPTETTTTTTGTTSVPITVTTTSGETSIPITTTSTSTTQVPSGSEEVNIPSVQSNPLPETKPTKPPMDFVSTIVWILLNIKRILWG